VLVYETSLGAAYCDKSEDFLISLDEESVDLIITSPPFPLTTKKSYGNYQGKEFVCWLLSFMPLVYKVLKPTGSFVIELGGTYQKGKPIRSLYQYEFLIDLCENYNFFLAEEFFWHNTAKLPSPFEWVCRRKIRAKDAISNIWWLSKSEFPKTNLKNVLIPYSDDMLRLLADNRKLDYQRPSGHKTTKFFRKDNGGAIPSNVISCPNTESNSVYIKSCKSKGLPVHPARFPAKIPEFFIKFLTDPNDLVLDIFAGSNTTGEVAERLNRRWISIDCDLDYVIGSAFRFKSPKYCHAKLSTMA